MNATKEAEVNFQIEQARKQFYNVLMTKKRSVRRKWLEMGSITNQHQISTLPYRAMLQNAENFLDECNKIEDNVNEGENRTETVLSIDSDNSLSSRLSELELTSESFNLDETDDDEDKGDDKTELDDMDGNNQIGSKELQDEDYILMNDLDDTEWSEFLDKDELAAESINYGESAN